MGKVTEIMVEVLQRYEEGGVGEVYVSARDESGAAVETFTATRITAGYIVDRWRCKFDSGHRTLERFPEIRKRGTVMGMMKALQEGVARETGQFPKVEISEELETALWTGKDEGAGTSGYGDG